MGNTACMHIVEVLLHYDVNVYLGENELCMESDEHSDSDPDGTPQIYYLRVLKKINAQKLKAQHGDK